MEKEIKGKCGQRISQALDIRNIKQAELCEKTKIPKSALSQYISGAFEPKQDRLLLIAQALNVDPVWLMGFDVPMEREDRKLSPDENKITEGEQVLLDLFRRVPEGQQKLVLQMIRAALGTQE